MNTPPPPPPHPPKNKINELTFSWRLWNSLYLLKMNQDSSPKFTTTLYTWRGKTDFIKLSKLDCTKLNLLYLTIFLEWSVMASRDTDKFSLMFHSLSVQNVSVVKIQELIFLEKLCGQLIFQWNEADYLPSLLPVGCKQSENLASLITGNYQQISEYTGGRGCNWW